MSEIKYRLAKPSDAKAIANLHWHVRDRYTQGIFLSLGEGFLESYYKITLNDPGEVVVCAINEEGKIIGFNGTTLDAKQKYENVRSHKIKLGFAALKTLILHPSLIKEVWQRYRSLGNKGPQFIKVDGARGGYWCWHKDYPSIYAFKLREIKDDILRDLGLKEYYFEVDKSNEFVYKYQLRVSKAEPIEEITLPDGRVRVLMRKKLQ